MAGKDGWMRSSFCDNSSGNCVEIKKAGNAFALRDGKVQDGPVLVFSEGEMEAFFAGVKAGEFV